MFSEVMIKTPSRASEWKGNKHLLPCANVPGTPGWWFIAVSRGGEGRRGITGQALDGTGTHSKCGAAESVLLHPSIAHAV